MQSVNSYPLSRNEFVVAYPPVRHWHRDAVDDLLREYPEYISREHLNLYIHIPFCYRQCAFCYYMTVKPMMKIDRDEFISRLCREIGIVSERYQFKARPIRSIYIGGGTPTLLGMTQLNKLISQLHSCFSIDQPEFTIEAEPLTLTKKKIVELESLGINRISIGVQSFCDSILNICGRHYFGHEAEKTIQCALMSGKSIINIDLLSGLPGETMATWRQTINRSISIGVHHITVYRMIRYPNTEVSKRVASIHLLPIPDDQEETVFMDYALDQFIEADYQPWSFFSFSKNGRYQHVHSPSLWKGEDFYGFGPSAFSTINNWEVQNTNNFETYLSSLKDNNLPYYRAYRLNEVDKKIKAVLLGMKLLQINEKALYDKYGFDFSSFDKETVEWLLNRELIKISDGVIHSTRKGMLYGDSIGKILAKSLMKYFRKAAENTL